MGIYDVIVKVIQYDILYACIITSYLAFIVAISYVYDVIQLKQYDKNNEWYNFYFRKQGVYSHNSICILERRIYEGWRYTLKILCLFQKEGYAEAGDILSKSIRAKKIIETSKSEEENKGS